MSLREFERTAVADIGDAVGGIVFKLWYRFTVKSPVDLGTFKGNWNVSVGAPDFTYTIFKEPSGDVFGAAPSQDRITEVQNLLLKVDGTKPVYICNGLPYAARLETGYSKKAPLGIVDVTLVEFSSLIKYEQVV